ncbi:MerR family DNA-binding transcriptional regulator [Marinibaculum pumilum]|uniref:MerR family DNA-binding transcriptional regulator n=1 Tax=Marinibaculum pumilum TaxID=1766165 RepID=A0ABV7L953_9PROT
MKKTFTITELSDAFGVTPRAIRFYEDKGLLAPARQGQSRIYSRADRTRLALILRGKRLGFSLAEIQELLDLYDPADGQVEQIRQLNMKAADRISELERQAAEIESMLRELRLARAAITEFLQVRDAGTQISWRDYVGQREAERAACATAGAPLTPSGRTWDPDRPFSAFDQDGPVAGD